MKQLFVLVMVLILWCVLAVFLQACTTRPLYFVSSNGILTYDRHTGRLEVLWEYVGKDHAADSSKAMQDTTICSSFHHR